MSATEGEIMNYRRITRHAKQRRQAHRRRVLFDSYVKASDAGVISMPQAALDLMSDGEIFRVRITGNADRCRVQVYPA